MQRVLVYEGPFGPTLKILKRVSVFSCGCTLVGVPLLTAFGNPDMSLKQRASIGAVVCFFAVTTTAALTYVSKPYIWRIYREAGSKAMEIQSFNLYGGMMRTELKNGLNDIRACKNRVFSNMSVVSGKDFYLHEEPDFFASDELFQEIMKAANITPGATSK